MAELLLLRHGQSEWNRLHLYQGQADPPLTALGEQQARLAAEKLRGSPIPMVASSDLRRALRTAELMADALGVEGVVVEPGVRERDTGEWTREVGGEKFDCFLNVGHNHIHIQGQTRIAVFLYCQAANN